MILCIFIFFWLFMFLYQFRSAKEYNGYVDMKNYTFCSNLIFNYPKWLIYLLFFNNRLTKLPLTIIVGQIMNYILGSVFLFSYIYSITKFYIPLLKIWGVLFIILIIIMCIDHELYCIRHRKK